MSRQGWEKWWWHDWLSDPELQSATPATRGIWINLLGHMWVKSGHQLTLPIERFCRLAGCSAAEFEAFLDECDELGFCDMSRESNARITLTSRRRHRQDKARENNRLRQQAHRRNAKITHTEAEAEAEAEAEKEKKILPTGVQKKAASERAKNRPQKHPPAAPAIVFPDGLCRESWEAYLTHRRAIRARALKPKSQERLMSWLVEQGPPETQAAIVDTTVRNGWTGLFELKVNGNDRPRLLPKLKQRLPADYYKPDGSIREKYRAEGRCDTGAGDNNPHLQKQTANDALRPNGGSSVVDQDAGAAMRAIRAAAGDSADGQE